MTRNDANGGPGAARLLIYMLAAAGLAGGMAGWLQSSGAMDWAGDLIKPTWTPSGGLLVCIGMFLLQPVAISLWIVQRSGRDGMRVLASALLIGLLVLMVGRVIIFFSTRDLGWGFLANLTAWVYALIAIGIIGRASRPSGLLLWPSFIWLTFTGVLVFEIMRLNPLEGFSNF